MAFTLTVTGIDELRARIAALRAALPEAMRSALDTTGTAVVGDLQQQAPSGGNDDAPPPLGDAPGKLRDSFISEITEDGLQATLLVSTTQPQKLAWVRYGRGPVYPVNKKALFWPGLAHPVKYAGPSQPNEFVEPVISQAPDFAIAAFEEAVNAVLEG
jgi:hypothetical protein